MIDLKESTVTIFSGRVGPEGSSEIHWYNANGKDFESN